MNNIHSPRALAVVPPTDDSIGILRLTQARGAEAHLVVGVEFDPENNEVVGKVYDAESQLKYASEPRGYSRRRNVRAMSPASFANWRLRSLATRASNNQHQITSRRIPPHEAPTSNFLVGI